MLPVITLMDPFTCTCNEGFSGTGEECNGKKWKVDVTQQIVINLKKKCKMEIGILNRII